MRRRARAGRNASSARDSTQPRARHVLDRDAAGADRVDEAGHADARGGVEFERIAPFGVDVAPEHVAALEPGDRAHEDAAVAHDQIVAFDEQEAEVAGEIGLLEIGRAQRAGRQNPDARFGALAARLEPGAQFAKERREAFDVHLAVEARKRLRDDEAVFQRVARARGRLRAIAQHPPAPVGPAADVGGVEPQPALARRRDAAHRGDEVGRSGQRGGGQHALGDQAALAIDVGEHAFEQFGALGDAVRDLAPFGFGNHQRHAAERPHPLGRLALHAIGHAAIADAPVGGGEALRDLAGFERRERLQQPLPMRAARAVGADELVGNPRKRRVVARPRGDARERVVVVRRSGPGASGQWASVSPTSSEIRSTTRREERAPRPQYDRDPGNAPVAAPRPRRNSPAKFHSCARRDGRHGRRSRRASARSRNRECRRSAARAARWSGAGWRPASRP